MSTPSSPNSPDENASGHVPIKLSDVKHPVLWAALAMLAAIFIHAIVMGQFGQIGTDGDDVMRFVQIRDYLQGQSWFNTDQLRLGFSGAGTDMHWSRLVDVPLILLTHIFSLFMEQEAALMLASSIWPPLTAVVLIFAITKGSTYYADVSSPASAETRASGHKTAMTFTLVLLAFFVIRYYRFEPGAIDHHNIQTGLLALALAGGLDPKSRFTTHFVAGTAAALSLAIGTEVYIFAAVICAYMALNWLIRGAEAARASEGFGLGLAGMLLLCFFGTLAPSEYMAVKCDSLSLITVLAGGVGGVGLTILGRFFSGRDIKIRIMAAAAIGAVCLLIFSFQAPQCMANPLSELPDDVTRLWLDLIEEAQPIWTLRDGKVEFILLFMGPPLLALYLLVKRLRHIGGWSPLYLLFGLLVSAIGLSIYQIRFNTFSYVFSLIPLAAWVGVIYNSGKAKAQASENGSNIAYIGALALSIPMTWALPVLATELISPNENAAAHDEASEQVAACFSEDVLKGLRALPIGTIASTSNGGARILFDTDHRALSGNYHRNIAGISAQIHLATSAPDQSYDILKTTGSDYLHFCKASPETNNLVKENKDGLYAQLSEGNVPDFLSPALVFEEGNVVIYKVN